MKLRNCEQVIKVCHHSLFGFLKKGFSYIVISIPLYLVVYFFSGLMGAAIYWNVLIVMTALLLATAVYDMFLYYLDRLVITNCRILHVDWKSFTSRLEHEAELDEIQDISTQETGVFSLIPLFDFGLITIKTAASIISINFTDAQDPEGIKQFIYHINRKPTRITPSEKSNESTCNSYDQERTESGKTVSYR